MWIRKSICWTHLNLDRLQNLAQRKLEPICYESEPFGIRRESSGTTPVTFALCILITFNFFASVSKLLDGIGKILQSSSYCHIKERERKDICPAILLTQTETNMEVIFSETKDIRSWCLSQHRLFHKQADILNILFFPSQYWAFHICWLDYPPCLKISESNASSSNSWLQATTVEKR